MHFYNIAKGMRTLAKEYGLQGISQEEFIAMGANMQYEYPVPGTNNTLYYTMERVTGVPREVKMDDGSVQLVDRTSRGYMGGSRNGGYAQRKVEMNKYFGQGPLDFLFPKLNPSGEAFW